MYFLYCNFFIFIFYVYLGDVGVTRQAVFRGARERRGDVSKEAEGIAHGYHHAPSPNDVHRVGRGRTYFFIFLFLFIIAHGYHHAPSPNDVHRVGRGRTYFFIFLFLFIIAHGYHHAPSPHDVHRGPREDIYICSHTQTHTHKHTQTHTNTHTHTHTLSLPVRRGTNEMAQAPMRMTCSTNIGLSVK